MRAGRLFLMLMLTRRDVLTRLGGAAAAVALSPLLDLAPILPAPSLTAVGHTISLDEITAITLHEIMPGIVEDLFRADPFFDYLQRRGA